MSAVLDRPPGLVPTIGGSTYVKPSEMDWKPTRFEKVSIKVLYEDPKRGEVTCLLKLEPGAHIPFYQHPEIEQTLVLEKTEPLLPRDERNRWFRFRGPIAKRESCQLPLNSSCAIK